MFPHRIIVTLAGCTVLGRLADYWPALLTRTLALDVFPRWCRSSRKPLIGGMGVGAPAMAAAVPADHRKLLHSGAPHVEGSSDNEPRLRQLASIPPAHAGSLLKCRFNSPRNWCRHGSRSANPLFSVEPNSRNHRNLIVARADHRLAVACRSTILHITASRMEHRAASRRTDQT